MATQEVHLTHDTQIDATGLTNQELHRAVEELVNDMLLAMAREYPPETVAKLRVLDTRPAPEGFLWHGLLVLGDRALGGVQVKLEAPDKLIVERFKVVAAALA